MRLMILTSGTRGDVEPFVALARYAAQAGHEVRIGMPRTVGVDATGVDAVSLGPPFSWLTGAGQSPGPAVLHRLHTTGRPALRAMFGAAVRETLAYRPDLVVHHPLVLTAPAVADALRVPRVVGEFVPVATPSRMLPAPGTPAPVVEALERFPRLAGPQIRATYRVPRLGARLLDRDVARACSVLPGGRALRPRTPSRATLVAVSRHLLPRPPDWPARVHLTGPWLSPTHDADPVEAVVDRFMHRGPYLVASFGSMAAGDPAARTAAVVAAARAHGLRTLLLTGWGGLALPVECRDDDVLAVPTAPLSAVLAGAAVAIHHGGAGTAHAVARAGVPSVVVPFLADQAFWARRLQRLGIGAPPLSRRRLTPDALAGAVQTALRCRRQAQEIGRAMAAENGLEVALEVLTSLG